MDDVADERRPVPIRATGYVRLHIPATAPSPAPVLLALHGYGQPPAALFGYAREVAPADAVVVAPEGPQPFYAERWRADVGHRRVGYGWIADRPRDDAEARNRDLLERALELAAAEHPIDPARTWLLGYSQGVGVAADFAVHAPERIAGFVGLAGGVPAASRAALAALRGRPVLWITGTRDRFYPADYNAGVLEALEAAGTDLTSVVLESGHDILDAAREHLHAWFVANGSAQAENLAAGE